MKIFCFAIVAYLTVSLNLFGQAMLVHNTHQDIEACKGKLKLKLIRVWGGDEDENKFFITPSSIAIDDANMVYISDMHGQCIKVFEFSGKYLRTIGRKGRGPGDVVGPDSIDISPGGDLLVNELGGLRIQRFSPEGESKGIVKSRHYIRWINVTSKDELAAYGPYNTFLSRKLISIYDRKGNVIREIGRYHDTSRSYLESEKLGFAMDDSDNIYAANNCTPVIRKYSPEGKLLMAITFGTPFDIPVKISLNSRGDEIERNGGSKNREKIRKNRVKRRVSIVKKTRKSKKIGVFSGIYVDSQKNIYAVVRRRLLTEKEMMAGAISGNPVVINRERVDFDIVENIDVNRLLVFNQAGKVIAEVQMTTFCDDIYIKNNRIFVIDGMLNQRILEYEMSILASKKARRSDS